MLTALACTAVLLLLALTGAAWKYTAVAQVKSRDGLLTERLRERFIVTVEGGRTFDGLLAACDERTVVLIDCTAIQKDDRPFPVDGEVVLRRDSIAYMQKP